MTAKRLNVGSIERALENAKRNGWVEHWERHPEGGHIVYIPRWGPERFKTIRETNAFALGLAAVDCNPQEYIDPSEIMNPEQKEEGESK